MSVQPPRVCFQKGKGGGKENARGHSRIRPTKTNKDGLFIRTCQRECSTIPCSLCRNQESSINNCSYEQVARTYKRGRDPTTAQVCGPKPRLISQPRQASASIAVGQRCLEIGATTEDYITLMTWIERHDWAVVDNTSSVDTIAPTFRWIKQGDEEYAKRL